MSTGQPPNQTTVTKAIGTTLNSWVDVLTSGDTGWATGVTWVASIRFENSVGNSAYSLPGKSVAVPTPPPPPPPPPSVTHVWSFDRYTGCGPTRKKVEECSNGHSRHTRQTNASEPIIWGDWENVGSPVITYGSWSNVGSPQLISGVCKQRKERGWTRSQRQESTNQCGGTRFKSVTRKGTEFNYDTVSETWGSWSDTGSTRENEFDYSIEKEQEKFSSPCNRRQTRWVAA